MRRTTLAWLAGALALAFLIFGALSLRGALRPADKSLAAARPQPAEPGGLHIDARAQALAGIRVATAPRTERRGEREAIATALPPQDLIDGAGVLAAAQAQADKAEAMLAASRQDYERIRMLHADDRNVSDKAFLAAQAAWRGDEAAARAARTALAGALASLRRKWGEPLAAAVAQNAPLFRQLAAGSETLLRVALPGGFRLERPPATLTVMGDDGRPLKAQFISAAPQADPRIQGPAYFYRSPGAAIAPGLVLAARLPGGPAEKGALLPASAVVWWQGKAWTYLQAGPESFERREIPGGRQGEDGAWFVPGFPAAPVVVQGAQALLSQELRAQIKVGDGEDEDQDD